MARRRSPRADQVGAFFDFTSRGLSPSRAWREAGFRSRQEAERALGPYLRKSEAAYRAHRGRGGKRMWVLTREFGLIPARVYRADERSALARYMSHVGWAAENKEWERLRQFEGVEISTSAGRIRFLTRRSDFARFDRLGIDYRGVIDSLYLK
jgi:hypothetical protein